MVLVLDAAGWIGGVFVTVGYVLVSMGQLTAASRRFQMLNVAGGVLLTGTALYRGALPNTVINIVWIVFGVYALVSARSSRQAGDEADPDDARTADEPDPDVDTPRVNWAAVAARVIASRRRWRSTAHPTAGTPAPRVANPRRAA